MNKNENYDIKKKYMRITIKSMHRKAHALKHLIITVFLTMKQKELINEIGKDMIKEAALIVCINRTISFPSAILAYEMENMLNHSNAF